MGLQVTASKRKLEDDGKGQQTPQPAKVGRTEETVREAVLDVTPAPELDDWRVDSTSSVLASTLLGTSEAELIEDDDDEDDEDDDDEEEEEEEKGKYLPAGRGYCVRYSGDTAEVGSVCYSQPVELKPLGYYGTAEDQGGYSGSSSSAQYGSRQQHYQSRSVSQYWGPQGGGDSGSGAEYYGQDPSSQQTIRCDENGKSYLDLGSSSARYVNGANSSSASNSGASNLKCCDGSRTNWCSQGPNTACYRQRRLAVLNISMCKLGRYRQFPDPSLHRSVLICNTLRYIEREMEQEGFFFNNATGTVQAPVPPPPPTPTPHPAVDPDPSYHHPQFPEVPTPNMNYLAPSAAYRTLNPCPELVPQYEQNLRDLSTSGRATPFPTTVHPNYETDSGVGDEESGRGINWGSVLSLSSQSDLDPLNNNELYPSSPSHSSASSASLPGLGSSDSSGSLGLLGDMDLGHEFDDFLPSWKLTPLSADDILKSVPPSEFSGRQGEGELDSIMHVLVGT